MKNWFNRVLSGVSRGTVITGIAFLGILIFIAISIDYSAQGMRPLMVQLEGATDLRLKKSLLVNQMVTAGNRRALLLSKIPGIQDEFERDALLMIVYERGADFIEARQQMMVLPLDGEETQLLMHQARIMQQLTPKVNEVIELIELEALGEARSFLQNEVLPLQTVMLGSLSQLGRYQQAIQYQHLASIRETAEAHHQRFTVTGMVVMAVVLMIATGVLRALVLGGRERRSAYQQLEESHRRLNLSMLELRETTQLNTDRQYALDQSALVLMTDPEGRITYVNDKYCLVSGYRREDLLGWTPKVFGSGYHSTEFWTEFWRQIRMGHVVRREICNRTRDGEEFWISSTTTPLLESDLGVIRGYLSIGFDVTDRKWIEDELQQTHDAWRKELDQRHSEMSQMAFVASHDSLTQLPNQELLLDRISHAIKRSGDDPEQPPFSLLELDLVNFRMINEGLGSAIGDQLLIHVAARINKIMPASATVARIGGKKFAILREEMEGAEETSMLIQQLFNRLQSPFQIGDHEIHLEVVMGAALYPDDGEEADLLMNNVSVALHQAKERGERYLYYKQDLNARAQRYALMMHELRRAVQEGEFEIYYQPKVSQRSGLVEGAEALIRWSHTERGIVAPGEFISLLESSGLIHSVGRWILQSACMQAKRWIDRGMESFQISVNITVDQLQSSDIVEIVEQALEQSGLPPHCLELEITESHYMDQLELSLQHLMALREVGVQIAIDDFGTGHSSLAYLLHLPVDILKIDKCFIDHIPDNPQDLFLVETILGIGERLGLKVVAEGVEHEQQLEWLRGRGCDGVQGFYYSEPLPAEALELWMREQMGVEMAA